MTADDHPSIEGEGELDHHGQSQQRDHPARLVDLARQPVPEQEVHQTDRAGGEEEGAGRRGQVQHGGGRAEPPDAGEAPAGAVARDVTVDRATRAEMGEREGADDGPGQVPQPQGGLAELAVHQARHHEAGDRHHEVPRPAREDVADDPVPAGRVGDGREAGLIG
jgi:hypothetical protein